MTVQRRCCSKIDMTSPQPASGLESGLRGLDTPGGKTLEDSSLNKSFPVPRCKVLCYAMGYLIPQSNGKGITGPKRNPSHVEEREEEEEEEEEGEEVEVEEWEEDEGEEGDVKDIKVQRSIREAPPPAPPPPNPERARSKQPFTKHKKPGCDKTLIRRNIYLPRYGDGVPATPCIMSTGELSGIHPSTAAAATATATSTNTSTPISTSPLRPAIHHQISTWRRCATP
ncbi:unnamed protein product [Gadus morhua 'NCC']